MKATINRTFSDAGLAAPCDQCGDPLQGGTQLWKIDDDDSMGFFCSRLCAEQAIGESESPSLGQHDEQRTSDACERGICLRPDHTL